MRCRGWQPMPRRGWDTTVNPYRSCQNTNPSHTFAKTACLTQTRSSAARTRLALKAHVWWRNHGRNAVVPKRKNNNKRLHNTGVVSAPQTAPSFTEEPLLSFWRQTHMVWRDDACSMQQRLDRKDEKMDGWLLRHEDWMITAQKPRRRCKLRKKKI